MSKFGEALKQSVNESVKFFVDSHSALDEEGYYLWDEKKLISILKRESKKYINYAKKQGGNVKEVYADFVYDTDDGGFVSTHIEDIDGFEMSFVCHTDDRGKADWVVYDEEQNKDRSFAKSLEHKVRIRKRPEEFDYKDWSIYFGSLFDALIQYRFVIGSNAHYFLTTT